MSNNHQCRNKNNKKDNDFIKAFEMLKLASSIKRGLLPFTIIERLLSITIVYINIIFGAKIIDGIADVFMKTKAGQMTESELGINEAALIKLALIMVCTNMVLALIRWGINKWLFVMRREVEDTVSKRVSQKGLTLDYQILEKAETLDYIQKATMGTISHGGVSSYCYIIGEVITHIVSIIYACVIMSGFFTNTYSKASESILKFINTPQAGILIFCMISISVVMRFLLTKRINKIDYEFFEANVRNNRQFSVFFTFLYDYKIGKQVRIYDMVKMISDGVHGGSKYFMLASDFVTIKTTHVRVLSELISGMLILTCYIFVGLKAVSGAISIGEMTLYIGALTDFSSAVSQIFDTINQINIRNNYLSNYTEFLAIQNEKYDGTLPIEKRLDNEYELEFRNVSFHYPNSKENVLNHITTKIHVGRKMAIVGRNGSGKSTFIKLLCRLYDPTEGEILLNGIDIKKYDYDEYRQIFGVVFQDFKLFSFPIAQNVAAGIDYDEEKVWKALRQAGLEERVKEMKNGIKTVIYKQAWLSDNEEDEGVEISGGEEQKLAIARALYKDAPIVILDEPTSALDPISELEIYERFNKMTDQKTAIYISHRMSSCRFCENILVFDKGDIVQMGSHDELVKQDGLYVKLWEAQAQYYNNAV